MVTILAGWITVLGLAYTTALYLMNIYMPSQDNGRVTIHCTVGKLTLVSMLVHIFSKPFNGFNQLAIWSAVGLVFITIGTGVILSYIPEAGNLRFHARSVHPALMVGIAVAVIHHILSN